MLRTARETADPWEERVDRAALLECVVNGMTGGPQQHPKTFGQADARYAAELCRRYEPATRAACIAIKDAEKLARFRVERVDGGLLFVEVPFGEGEPQIVAAIPPTQA